MALDLGTLTGYLELDSSAFDGVLDALPERMRGSGALMGAAAGIAALGIGAALTTGIANGIEAERLNAALGAALNLTGEESERAGAAAGSLYANAYGESLEEVSGAVESVISSIGGMREASQADLERITGSVMDMASAFELDTGRAAQVAGQLLTTGLARDADHAVDLLTASLQRVPQNVREDVLDAASEYGPMFAQLGYSGEEAMGLLASAGEQGAIGIDKMGDAMKEFTIRATDGSQASRDAYEAIGLNADDMANRILAGGDTAREATDQIIAGLQGISDPAARANASIALFGTPIEDLGTGAIPGFLDSLSTMGTSLGDVSGAAADMGATLNDNTATSWTQMQRTWDSIIGQVGGALVPVLGTVTDWLNANPAALQIVAAALGVLAAAFIGVSIATWAMNTALLANPITWIVIGIVALIAALVLLIANWDSVVAWITEVWGGFLGWLQEATDAMNAWWNEMWAGFGSWVQGVWAGFIGWLQGVWGGFVGWLQASGNAIASWWNGLWSGIGSFLQGVWNAMVAWVVGIIVGWIAGMIAQGQRIGAFWSNLWTGIRTAASNAWDGIVSFLGGIPGRILAVFQGAGSWLVSIGRNILDGLMGGLQAGWNAVVGWINSLGGGIIDTFASILGIHSPSRVFRAFGVNITEGLVQGLGDGAGRVDERVAGLVRTPSASLSADELAAASQVYMTGGAGSGMPSTIVVVDVDGHLLGSFRVAAQEQSNRDGTTAMLGRKQPAPVL